MFLNNLPAVVYLFGVTLTLTAVSSEKILKASCHIQAGSGSSDKVEGKIMLEEKFKEDNSSSMTVAVMLTGFNETDNITSHGFHVHAVGKTTNKCSDAGPHYNVDNSVHGAPEDPKGKKHVGDFGNIQESAGGRIDTKISINFASLIGEHGIANRSLVVHENIDDLGKGNAAASNTTGNSGSRLGCCVINLEVANSSYHHSSIIFVFSSILSIFYYKWWPSQMN